MKSLNYSKSNPIVNRVYKLINVVFKIEVGLLRSVQPLKTLDFQLLDGSADTWPWLATNVCIQNFKWEIKSGVLFYINVNAKLKSSTLFWYSQNINCCEAFIASSMTKDIAWVKAGHALPLYHLLEAYFAHLLILFIMLALKW